MADALYRQCANYEAIVAACRNYDVPLFDGVAEAFGGAGGARRAGAAPCAR